MIFLAHGDIFDVDVAVLVNPVNCVGVMGKGLALQFKKRFPENFKFYRSMFERYKLRIGEVTLFCLDTDSYPLYIINFPTKDHWKDESKIEYIEAGLVDLVSHIKIFHIKSIAIPPLGCGLGGLHWSDVKALLYKYLAELSDITVILYEPERYI